MSAPMGKCPVHAAKVEAALQREIAKMKENRTGGYMLKAIPEGRWMGPRQFMFPDVNGDYADGTNLYDEE